jgi:hypothetical protein
MNISANIATGRDSSKLAFSTLTFADIPQISKLLVTVWPILYGAVGHPLFDVDYLRWIYGGPDSKKHVMIGAWRNDALVAYQSFLYRRISYAGKMLNAYLWTHATVSPQLLDSDRVKCAIQMIKQGVLFNANSGFFVEDCDLVFAFNEENSHTREVVDKVFLKHYGIDRKINSAFNQFIVAPPKLNKYLQENKGSLHPFDVRAVTEKESRELASLFNKLPQEPQFVMQMTEDELKHHFFGHPDHHTYAVEQDETLKACINFFPLQIVKENKTHLEVIIEFLISDPNHIEHAAHLLSKAASFAEKIGAKAIVFENANYLDYSLYHAIGLLPTLRKMTMSAVSRDGIFDYSGAFRCDVK